jgi:hypothetical protein
VNIQNTWETTTIFPLLLSRVSHQPLSTNIQSMLVVRYKCF